MVKQLIGFKRMFPSVWKLVEGVNGFLFRIRGKNMAAIAEGILRQKDGYIYSLVKKEDIPALKEFLDRQDAQSLRWFHPHSFETEELTRLWRNHAFLMMKVSDQTGRLCGYFFLRCFFIGTAFAGLIVDAPYRNKGIGTNIWSFCARICHAAKLKMKATISKENKPSMGSCNKGTSVISIVPLEGEYIDIECTINTDL